MSTVASTGMSLSQNYYLRSYYQNNQKMFKSSTRKETSNSRLSYEDGLALRRAARNLQSFEYSENDNGENICNSILAFIDTYNNTLKSGGSSSSSDVNRYARQLKQLSRKYSDDLSSLGITVNTDGTMTANKNLLGKSSASDVGKVFGKESDFTKKTEQYAHKMESKSSDSLYATLTGSGSNIDFQA